MHYSGIIIIASHIPILSTAALAAVHFNRLDERFKRFCWFLFFSGIVQGISLLLWFFKKNNMPLLHVYVPVGMWLLAWFYNGLIQAFVNRRIIIIGAAVFVVLSVINSLYLQSVWTFNSHALTAQAILVMVLSIFTYMVHMNLPSENNGKDIRNLNLINSGLFIYYASTLLLFYFGNTIMKVYSVSISAYTWIFHSFFSVVMYIFFFISLWKQAKTSRW
jgi:hypothetical protein